MLTPVIENICRAEGARVLAGLIRRFGDFDLAEDALQDAFAKAIEVWPAQGLPAVPAAWLTTVAQRRALDLMRRRRAGPHYTDEPPDVAAHVGAQLGVEMGDRLVEEEQPRLAHDRPPDRHALPFPARQCVRATVEQPANAKQFDHFVEPHLARRCAAHAEPQVGHDRHMRKQLRVLKYQTGTPAFRW